MSSGETMAWMRLADEQNLPLQECQEANTSTEFIQWTKYYDDKERKRYSKLELQVAMVAQMVGALNTNLCKIFGGKGSPPSFEQCLIKYNDEDETSKTEGLESLDFESGGGKPGIEMGVDPLDEKWQKVNDDTKALFAGWFGPDFTAKVG